MRELTSSRLAFLAARALRDAFAEHRRSFRSLTQRRAACFARRDWTEARRISRERLELYRKSVDRAEAHLRELLGARIDQPAVWIGMKAVYSGLIADRHDWDLAETFFNSVTRRIFSTVGVDPDIEFVDTDFRVPPTRAHRSLTRVVVHFPDAERMVAEVLHGLDLGVPWADPAEDARLAGARIERDLRAAGLPPVPNRVEVLRPVFYRGKAAYVVGAMVADRQTVPLVLALRNTPVGLHVDAVLTREADLSMLFGFTRSYFHVDTTRPYDLVRFLSALLPRKGIGELYISIGEPKQGKTQLYRDLLAHLRTGRERLVHAEGTPGLVMVVFTLPGFGWVLKVIRDRFPPEKQVTDAQVLERYRQVYVHDRAGRLVDAQPFEHLALPVDRFDPALLEHLLASCSRRVRVEGDRVVLAHAYIERKVRPLDLYVREAPEEAARAAVLDYAQAIKDLAACNLFPGDLLVKNFGVTRHGRVAFYDYDEIMDLGSCVFREIPPPRSPEDEWAAEPWYPVGPNDLFPEEWPRFLGLPRPLRSFLVRSAPELFTADFWRGIQARLAEGKILEFPPYRPEHRLRPGG